MFDFVASIEALGNLLIDTASAGQLNKAKMDELVEFFSVYSFSKINVSANEQTLFSIEETNSQLIFTLLDAKFIANGNYAAGNFGASLSGLSTLIDNLIDWSNNSQTLDDLPLGQIIQTELKSLQLFDQFSNKLLHLHGEFDEIVLRETDWGDIEPQNARVFPHISTETADSAPTRRT